MLTVLGAPVPADDIAWTTDPVDALAAAGSSSKPIMADLWAVWCAPCKQLEETTYRDAEVVRVSAGFVPLKLDVDVHVTFASRHRADSFPTILFLDERGREITRLRGFVPAPRLLETMEVVLRGYATYRDVLDRREDPAAAERAGAYLLAAGNAEAATDLLRRALKRLDGQDPASRRPLELGLAEAQLAAGQLKTAQAALERLDGKVADPALRSRILVGLVRVQRERGRKDEAEITVQRLRREFPELADELAARP